MTEKGSKQVKVASQLGHVFLTSPDAMAEVQPEGNKMVKESRGGLGREVDTLKSKTQTVQMVSKY